MPIAEDDISILIPTYRYREKVTRAVRSAIASGAGEIIVVDDCSKDGTIEALAEFSDPRLVVCENERNLGLWENHLRALGMARRPWIKFIQADDYLLAGGLATYAAAADPDVALITGVAVLKDDETGETWLNYSLTSPLRLEWPAFERACLHFGNFVGSPSYMMLRADAIDHDPEVWRKAMSADMVVGAVAASRGAVVMLAPGAIGHGAHAQQDARTQDSELALARMANSLAYLRARPEPGLRQLANSWTRLALGSMFRISVRAVLRSEAPATRIIRPAWRFVADPGLQGWATILRPRADIRAVRQYRAGHRPPFDLDAFFTTGAAVGSIAQA